MRKFKILKASNLVLQENLYNKFPIKQQFATSKKAHYASIIRHS